MESANPEFALYGSTNQCTRTDTDLFSSSLQRGPSFSCEDGNKLTIPINRGLVLPPWTSPHL